MSYRAASRNKAMRLIATGAMSLLFPVLALAQNYVFGPNIRVNNDAPGTAFHSTYAPGQHCIAARGDTVYLVWRDDRGGSSHIYFDRSNDGGRTFLGNLRVDNTPPGCAGIIPSLAMDDSGGIHVCWLNSNSIQDGAFVYYANSTDGGRSFNPPVRACDSTSSTGYSWPSLAVSRDGRRVYVMRDEGRFIQLSRSTDGGRTFLSPDVRVSHDSIADWAPAVAVFHDTMVFVAWGTIDSSRAYYARSTNGGAQFGPTRLLTPDSLRGEDPSIATDTSGRVYIAWNDGYGLGVTVSTDTGDSFPPRWIVPGSELGGYHPSVHSSRDGRVFVAWYFYWGLTGTYEVRFAYSPDHGRMFLAPVNPSDAPDSAWEAEASVAANEDGRVFVAWTDDRYDLLGQNYDVFLASGALTAIEESDQRTPPRFVCQAVQNPASSPIRLECMLPRTGQLRVAVYDESGRLIRKLFDGLAKSGPLNIVWDGRDCRCRRANGGVYYVRFRVGEDASCQKVILIRE